jgi:hypothetical protein
MSTYRVVFSVHIGRRSLTVVLQPAVLQRTITLEIQDRITRVSIAYRGPERAVREVASRHLSVAKAFGLKPGNPSRQRKFLTAMPDTRRSVSADDRDWSDSGFEEDFWKAD